MKLEQAHLGQAGCEQYVGGIAGHAAAGDAVLSDVDRTGDGIEQAWRGFLGGGPVGKQPGRIAAQSVDETLQRPVAVLFPIAGLGEVLAEDVAVEIDGDHHLGAQGVTQGDRHWIDEPTVHEPVALVTERREKPGQSDGRHHRIEHLAFGEPDLAPVDQIGGHAAVGGVELFDEGRFGRHIAGQVLAQAGGVHQAVEAPVDVEEGRHVALAQGAHPGFEIVEVSGDLSGADDGTDGATGDHRRSHAHLFQGAKNADV